MSSSPTRLRLLFVCTANICRSPFAEGYARGTADGRLDVASAGTWALEGRPVDPPMVVALERRGCSAEGLSSHRVGAADVAAADLVLTMEDAHRVFLLEDHPAAVARVFTLGQFAEGAAAHPGLTGRELVDELGRRRHRSRPEHDVADPYGRGDAAIEEAATRIADLVDTALLGLVG